jgi:hypothetical protein
MNMGAVYEEIRKQNEAFWDSHSRVPVKNTLQPVDANVDASPGSFAKRQPRFHGMQLCTSSDNSSSDLNSPSPSRFILRSQEHRAVKRAVHDDAEFAKARGASRPAVKPRFASPSVFNLREDLWK